MTQTADLAAADPAFAMDAALNRPEGFTLRFALRARAEAYRARCLALRRAERQRAVRAHPDPLDPEHGTSRWDDLTTDLTTTAEGTMLRIYRPSAELAGIVSAK